MKSFDEFYKEIYSKNNKELENIKEFNKQVDKKLMVTTIIIVFITIFIAIAIPIIACYFAERSDSIILIMSTAFGLLLIFILALIFIIVKVYPSITKKEYKTVFKDNIIKELVKYMDNNLDYDLNTGKDPVHLYNSYRKCGFENYNEYDAEDYIEGMLDGKYQIRMAEVHTELEKEDIEGNTSRITVFHGIFCNIGNAKNIKTTLKIHINKKKMNMIKNKKKLEMDSSEFEEYFDVYTDNKIVAMQILTTDVMEMMIEYLKKYKIMYELTIKENQIYIRFHTGEVFEPKMNRKALDYDMLNKYYGILDFILNVTRQINKVIENTDI